MKQSRFASVLAVLPSVGLGCWYVGAQLSLRGVAVIAPRFAPLTVIASVALLFLLIGTVTYLRDDNLFVAGAMIALIESVSHLTTDVGSDLLTGDSIGTVVAALPRAFLELLVRLGVLSATMMVLVWLLRRLRPREAFAD